MTRMDKLVILAAWAVMAAVGVFGIWKTAQSPRIDPQIAKLTDEFARIYREPGHPPGDVRFTHPAAYFGPVADVRPVASGAEDLPLKLVGKGIVHPIVPVQILPVAVMGEAKADLDGVKIAWSLLDPAVTLQSYHRRSAAKAAGFIVERQNGNGPVEQIAKVGAEARTYVDLSSEPKRTYRYWVTITGEETALSSTPALQEKVEKRAEKASEVSTPSATRVKLVGGDKAAAILKVETYDRPQKKFVGKILTVPPGKEIGSSGWVLKKLSFDNFTLVADVADDGGVDRVLTTKD